MNAKILKMAILVATSMPAVAPSQEAWQFRADVNTMTGDYKQAQIMRKQHGQGIRLSGEQQNVWGFSAGLQSTHIDMQPMLPKATQSQNNWVLSAHRYAPSLGLTGRWKMQMDAHRVFNDTLSGNSSGVTALVPRLIWVSLERPLTLELSYARSDYNNSPTIHQFSPSVGLGFNHQRSWLQARAYMIQNLDPSTSMGLSSTHASDIRLTQFFQNTSHWMPQSITLGMERGHKIYFVDMTTQTVHNLPMRNDGGESISAIWKLNAKTQLTLQLQDTSFFSNTFSSHDFSLRTFSAQLGRDL